jgi:hypothetical protein
VLELDCLLELLSSPQTVDRTPTAKDQKTGGAGKKKEEGRWHGAFVFVCNPEGS